MSASTDAVTADLAPRARGVIALVQDKCTSCMLCVRECPDWCIDLDSHQETQAATTPHGRPRSINVLDRFVLDFSLCMYCGICVDVCPFDALYWAPAFAYSAPGRRDLTQDGPQLESWLSQVSSSQTGDTGASGT
jgi:NADH-quinone oxidoreductase subunit I